MALDSMLRRTCSVGLTEAKVKWREGRGGGMRESSTLKTGCHRPASERFQDLHLPDAVGKIAPEQNGSTSSGHFPRQSNCHVQWSLWFFCWLTKFIFLFYPQTESQTYPRLPNQFKRAVVFDKVWILPGNRCYMALALKAVTAPTPVCIHQYVMLAFCRHQNHYWHQVSLPGLGPA